MSGQVTLEGQLRCTSTEQREAVLRHLPRHVELTRAEPGCLAFAVTPTADPLVWQVAERFADRAAFDAHQARVSASAWGRATAGVPRDYTVTEHAAAEPAPHVVRRGRGMPLLFVHGFEVDHRLLLDLEDLFTEDSPFERLHLDLAGFGGTPALPAPGGLPQLADWLDQVAGDLLGDAPFAAIGSSLGGLLVRELAARRPDQCRGLALLAPVVDPVPAHRQLPEPEVLVSDPELLASLDPEDAALYTEVAVVQSRATWERFRDAALPGLRRADAGAVSRLAADYDLPVLPDERLAGFAGPVLLVMGRQDAVVGHEDQLALSRRLPRATAAVLDRAGHNVHLDQPVLVRALLRSWLADLAGDADVD